MQRHGLAQFRHETRELMLHNFARAGRQALICVPDAYSLPVDLSTMSHCRLAPVEEHLSMMTLTRISVPTLAGWRYVMFKDSDTPAGMGGPQKVSVE